MDQDLSWWAEVVFTDRARLMAEERIARSRAERSQLPAYGMS